MAVEDDQGIHGGVQSLLLYGDIPGNTLADRNGSSSIGDVADHQHREIVILKRSVKSGVG